MLFALAFSAVAAANASASGATLFTCVKSASGDLFGPHCLKENNGNSEKYAHQTFAADTTGTLNNANTASGTTAAQSAIWRTTLAGVNVEITCATVEGEGLFANKEEGGEMFGHAEVTLSFTACVVKAPAGKGCKVKGEAITTETITGKTLGSGEKFRLTPKNAENRFFTFTLEGCSIAALNNSFPVTGSFEVNMNAATLFSTHTEVTTQATLKIGGQKGGFEGALTPKTHLNGTEVTKPLSVTGT
ncbi:MAG TPA: hypothetical protein VFJ57_06360 [Solirubrobacterales bacterium]|nr:hypothetical protein [Solirubrobacterales bacterium]